LAEKCGEFRIQECNYLHIILMEIKELCVSFVGFFLLIIRVLISVAFLTLLERKVLGYIQIRKGPNKVGVIGLLQPFSDAVKLFLKEQTYPETSNYLFYVICPIVRLFLSLFVWLIFNYIEGIIRFGLGILFFFCITRIGVYAVMLAGWSSNSVYALLGGLRAVAQTISYEVRIILILLRLVSLVIKYDIIVYLLHQNNVWFMILLFPLFICWFSTCLAETNRTPFDLAEGESELVSGFNVEYRRGGFAIIFISEYSSILFISILTVVIFIGRDLGFIFYIKLLIISFFFIWVRGTLPRIRYDKLINLTWKVYLPVALNFLLFYGGLNIVFNYLYWDKKRN